MTDAPMPALKDGYARVPKGKIASVVTCLEMHHNPLKPPPLTPPRPAPFAVERVMRPTLAWYRELYRKVGSEWLWFSRLRLSDDALQRILSDPLVWVFAVMTPAGAEGILELDFRVAGECELAFFGLTAKVRGCGMGRALMTLAIEQAFSQPITRFWVHSCSLDHPAALGFYVRSGFVAYERRIEVADDPRLSGDAPRTALPDVPIIE
jgi:GNAT superfamily N-acetyltransferase